MKKMKVGVDKQQMVLSIALLLVVFCISLYSGNYFSDDFGLYLAVIGLTGIYLKPQLTRVQAVIAPILLILQYIIKPQNADPLSQYIMCVAIVALAGFIFYLVIKRGAAYIEIANYRAEEAEHIIGSVQRAGNELDRSCQNSSGRIAGLKDANELLEENTASLREGAQGITEAIRSVTVTCEDVHDKLAVTSEQIGALNTEVKKVEDTLSENKSNIRAMDEQMNSVKSAVNEANEVFAILEEEIKEITAVTEQLTSIAASTKMLALNASIEAARAGQSGAGFAVVAGKVQDLAIDSTSCSDQVVRVVNSMRDKIARTAEQLTDSNEAINSSIDALNGLEDGFAQLISRFESLYSNIEGQNENIEDVDHIFNQLKQKVMDMNGYTEDNQVSVEYIIEAMSVYMDNMGLVIDDTKLLHELSASLLELTQE